MSLEHLSTVLAEYRRLLAARGFAESETMQLAMALQGELVKRNRILVEL